MRTKLLIFTALFIVSYILFPKDSSPKKVEGLAVAQDTFDKPEIITSSKPVPVITLSDKNKIPSNKETKKEEESYFKNLFNKYDKDFTPTTKFIAQFGEKARKVWDALLDEPLSNTKKSSLTLPISAPGSRPNKDEDGDGLSSITGYGDKNNSGISDSTQEESKDVKKRNDIIYVSWKMRDKCEGSKIIGFIAKTYSEKQALLKQTFVSLDKDDPFGCKEYRHPLSNFVPEDLVENGFSGFLSITGLKEDKNETEDAVWQNLIRPKDMSIGEQGIGAIQLTWDPSTSPNIAGYKFYFGRQSGKYTHVVDIGKTIKFKVAGLALGMWYFTCTAYDKAGNESGYANEVSVEVKDPRPKNNKGEELPNSSQS